MKIYLKLSSLFHRKMRLKTALKKIREIAHQAPQMPPAAEAVRVIDPGGHQSV